MAKVLAKDVFNTEYLCKHHTIDIEAQCEKLGGVQLDMANMKIVKDAMEKLCRMIHEHGCDVIDSQDPVRNNMFKQVRERRAGSMSEERAYELPKLGQYKDIAAYIGQLEKDKLYKVGMHATEEDYYCPLVSLIQLYRPAIRIETSMEMYTLAGYLSGYTYRRGALEFRNQDEKFIVVTPEASFEIEIPTKDVNEMFTVPGIGKVSFVDLMNKYYLVPSKFGNERVMKNDPDQFWKKIEERVMEDLCRYFSKGRQSLQDFLGF